VSGVFASLLSAVIPRSASVVRLRCHHAVTSTLPHRNLNHDAKYAITHMEYMFERDFIVNYFIVIDLYEIIFHKSQTPIILFISKR